MAQSSCGAGDGRAQRPGRPPWVFPCGRGGISPEAEPGLQLGDVTMSSRLAKREEAPNQTSPHARKYTGLVNLCVSALFSLLQIAALGNVGVESGTAGGSRCGKGRVLSLCWGSAFSWSSGTQQRGWSQGPQPSHLTRSCPPRPPFLPGRFCLEVGGEDTWP